MSAPREPEGKRSEPTCLTTMHVQRAVGGNRRSLDWIIAHFTPLLRAQAEYRLGRSLRSQVDPEDIVNSVWLVGLTRLDRLNPREGRLTPVLLKYLSTTMVLEIRNLRRRHARRNATQETSTRRPEPDEVAGETRGVVTRVQASETSSQIWQTIESLEPHDREILILRGIEQHAIEKIADAIGITPSAAYARYARAISRLQKALPGSIFDDLG